MSLCESHNGCKPYAMEKTSSFGSSTPLMAKQTPSLLQERLKYLVESRQEWWVYAIFWHACKDNYQHVSLSFGDCYYRGGQDNSQQAGINTDSGLIIASAGRSFVLGEDIVGGTFSTGSFVWLAGANALQMNGNKRAKEVHMHGIRTLVSVATSSGVVEFGSLNVLKEDWGLVRLTKSLFKPESDVTIVQNHCHQLQSFAHEQDSSLLDLQSPSNSTREDTPRKTSKKRKNITTDDRVNPIYKDIERARRGKLNQRFYELRSVVPFVTKMDKASLLADAVTYIGELKSRIETLTKKAESLHLIADDGAPMMTHSPNYCMVHTESQVQVKVVGSEAVIRMQSADANHPTARLMDALKNLEMGVHHASAANVSNMMVQDVIAHIPQGFPKDEAILTTLILKNL